MLLARRAVVLVAAAALSITLAPLSASAASGRSASPSLGSVRLATGAPAVAGVDANSEFFAGYTMDGGDTSATVVITTPTFTCDDTESGILPSVLAVDADGFINGGGGVYAACSGGDQVLVPVFVDSTGGLYGLNKPLAEGDQLRVTYAPDADAGSRVILANLTQDWTYRSPRFDYYATVLSQYGDNGLVDADDNPLPPPAFGSHKMTKVKTDGTKLTNANGSKYTLVDDMDNPVIKPGKVRKGGFTLTVV